jgi:hypothetical protein
LNLFHTNKPIKKKPSLQYFRISSITGHTSDYEFAIGNLLISITKLKDIVGDCWLVAKRILLRLAIMYNRRIDLKINHTYK